MLVEMVTTSARVLGLLSLLQSRRYWPGQELADRLGVTLRTLRRDVERLRELGYPVRAQRGSAGGYQLAPDAAVPPLLLEDDEAVALLFGLMAAANNPLPDSPEASLRALAKVVHMMPRRFRGTISALRGATEVNPWGPPGQPVRIEVLIALAQACRDHERAEISYTSAKGGVTTFRRVDPHRLVRLGPHWYLVAWDLTRHDWRTFRLDRMGTARVLRHSFMPRDLPAVDATEFVRARIAQVPKTHKVEASVSAPAASVGARIGRWAKVSPVDDNSCYVQMSTDQLEWAAIALALCGAEFVVHRPPRLLALLREWSDRLARAGEARRPSR